MARLYYYCRVIFASLILLSVFGSALSDDACANEKVLFCYYSSWAIYRPTIASFRAENIDATLCTHVVYSFAGISIDGVVESHDSWNDLPGIAGGNDQYRKFIELKEKNHCLKTLIALGGWNEKSEKFSLMVETEESRARFIDQLHRFLVYYGFDGVDIDWEYPTQRGGLPEDRQNFVLFLQELKSVLTRRGRLLTVAVGASEYLIHEAYDISGIFNAVDYILLMTYDYHRNDVTSLTTPLNTIPDDVNTGSVAESVNLWLDQSVGEMRSKLVLGLSTTARTFTLASPSPNPVANGLGVAVEGLGAPGQFTNSAGHLAYYEVCEKLWQGGWHVVESDIYACNYATKGDQWMTYDEENTIYTKAKYARDTGLAGAMVWTLDTDDFLGFCHTEPYSLLKAARRGLGL